MQMKEAIRDCQNQLLNGYDDEATQDIFCPKQFFNYIKADKFHKDSEEDYTTHIEAGKQTCINFEHMLCFELGKKVCKSH